jgi:hypothetical protein
MSALSSRAGPVVELALIAFQFGRRSMAMGADDHVEELPVQHWFDLEASSPRLQLLP